MTDKWHDLIRKELTRPEPEPAVESFYRGVWSRVRGIESGSAKAASSILLPSLGRMCWQCAPIFAGLLFVASFWVRAHPPDLHPDIMTSSESYVLDTDEAPSDTSLLYQITHAVPVSEAESK
jgi:hypothetical protein